MALTFELNPQLFTPAYNEITTICTSTNSEEPNFKVQVIVKDKDSNTLSTQLYPARPNGDIIIDVANVVQSQLASEQILYLLPAASGWGWQKELNTQQEYTITFQEWLGTTPAVTGAVSTGVRHVFNGSLRYDEYIDFDDADYLLILNDTKKFLTAQPTTRVIRDDESTSITMISDGDATANTIASLQIKTYTGTTLTQTATITNSLDPNSDNDNKCLSIMAGTRDLNNSTLATGSQPLITAAITSYTVQVLDGNGATSSELLTYNIDTDCSKYTATRLHFLNRLGGLDSFTFKMKLKKSETIKRDTFKRMGYMYDSTYNNSITERGRITYDTVMTNQYRISSDWITEADSEWLEDLFSSPEVYWERGTDDIVAISIQDRNYDEKTVVNDRLFNLNLSFELATDNIRQKG